MPLMLLHSIAWGLRREVTFRSHTKLILSLLVDFCTLLLLLALALYLLE